MTNRGTKEQSVFSPEESVIREELVKILASDTFARSERLRRFLRFTVENRLGGKTAVLKEAVIGVEVFDRLPTYDPKSEPIVRIEARRLRKKLQQYYASEGSRDPAVIDLPRGGYVPSFELRENPAIAFPLPVVPAETDKPPARRSSRRWVWWTAALLAGLAAAGFRLLDFGHEASPLQVVPLTTYLGMEMHPSVSPDSKQVAFTWDGEGNHFDIYVKLLDGSPPLRLTT